MSCTCTTTPAPDEHIICVDEKTSIQALERRYRDLPMGPGQVVRREFEYIRHGTLCLMGAFDVRSGKLFGFTCPGHSGATFVELLDIIDECYPTGRGHIVCDKPLGPRHRRRARLVRGTSRWTRHFNAQARLLAEPGRVHVLHPAGARHGPGSFVSLEGPPGEDLAYMLWYNQSASPSSGPTARSPGRRNLSKLQAGGTRPGAAR